MIKLLKKGHRVEGMAIDNKAMAIIFEDARNSGSKAFMVGPIVSAHEFGASFRVDLPEY